jgi:hypothetical protein
MNRFFIIGALPRSGTAWVSTLLNLHPDVFCFHEAMATDRPYRQVITEAMETHKIVVDCTTGIHPAYDCIEATRIFLQRHMGDCAESAIKAMGPVARDMWPSVVNNAARWVGKFHPPHINFDGLLQKSRGELEMLEHLLGLETPIDGAKVGQLRALNVQIEGLCEHYYDNKPIQMTP